MGIASLILGILGIGSALTLVLSPFGLIGVVVGLVLGIVDVVKKGKTGGKKGVGIAGIIICAFMTIVLMIETCITLLGLGIYMNAKDTVDNANSNYDLSSTEVAAFNSKFEKYEGRVNGSYVNLLLSIIDINNSTTSQNEVLCLFDGNIVEPDVAKNQIFVSRYYQVSFNHDSDGYINRVYIKSEASSLTNEI